MQNNSGKQNRCWQSNLQRHSRKELQMSWSKTPPRKTMCGCKYCDFWGLQAFH